MLLVTCHLLILAFGWNDPCEGICYTTTTSWSACGITAKWVRSRRQRIGQLAMKSLDSKDSTVFFLRSSYGEVLFKFLLIIVWCLLMRFFLPSILKCGTISRNCRISQYRSRYCCTFSRKFVHQVFHVWNICSSFLSFRCFSKTNCYTVFMVWEIPFKVLRNIALLWYNIAITYLYRCYRA